MRFFAKSDVGSIRDINEDSFEVLDKGYPQEPAFFLVADGMGGHNAGEIASGTAVRFVKNYINQNYQELFSASQNKIIESIEKTLTEANALLRHKSQDNRQYSGMGTTFILACIYDGRLHIGHVGDSRVYIVRDGGIIRITEDHSYTEELIKLGKITRKQAEEHPGKNVITRALGCEENIIVDKYVREVKTGDKIIICTDGLTNKVSEQEIAAIISNSTPEQACKKMVETANSLGGEDNITVIVVEI